MKQLVILAFALLLSTHVFANTKKEVTKKSSNVESHQATTVVTPVAPSTPYENHTVFANSKDTLYVYGAFGVANFAEGSVTDKATASSAISGIFGIGADVEKMTLEDMGLVGGFRYYSTEDDFKTGGATSKTKATLWLLNAGARFHFTHKAWDFAVTPGLAFGAEKQEFASTANEGSIGLFPTMAMTIMYALDDKLVMGIENMKVWGLGSTYNGLMSDDFMFKMRFALNN